jgi:hypothetical protein
MRRPIALRLDYDAVLLRRIARESEDPDQVRRLLTLAAIYRGHQPHGGCQSRLCDTASGARLGAAVERARSGGADRSEGAWASVAAERCASRRAGGDGGKRPDRRGARGGPLAGDRFLPVAVGRSHRSAASILPT